MTNAPETSAEDSLIARYFKPLATDPGAFGLVDDAAVLASSGEDIVVTTDAVVEGVHYLATDPPDTIARKALRVNLSDLAAKGASPAGFVLTLALRSKEDSWLRPFADALSEDAMAFSPSASANGLSQASSLLRSASVRTKPAGTAPLAARSDRFTRSALRAMVSGGSPAR